MALLRMAAEWRKVVTDPREVRLFEALEGPQFQWRTMQALRKASGMSEEEVRATVSKYPHLIRQGRSKSGEPIWTLQERYWKQLGVTQILDFMSNLSTSTG